MIRELPASTVDVLDRAMGRAVGLVVDSVDTALEAVPNPIPSGGQLRTTRANRRRNLAAGADRIRRPVLAGIGAADWLAGRLAAERPVAEPRRPAAGGSGDPLRPGAQVIVSSAMRTRCSAGVPAVPARRLARL